MLQLITLGFGIIFFLIILYTIYISYKENEKYAVRKALILLFIIPTPYLVIGLIDFPFQSYIALAIIVLTCLFFITLFLPYKKRNIIETGNPSKKVDERDIMFARNDLVPGTERFEVYYKLNPQNKNPDDKFRSRSGLLSPKASKFNPFFFASANASFFAVEKYHSALDGQISKNMVKSHPPEMARYIKNWGIKLGAKGVGITELKDYHLYSYTGRGKNYGNPIKNEHKFAIAFTVEMDKFMIDPAPDGPTVMESAQQYLESGTIAVQVAEFIRNLGYPAKAHIDGNYHVICPLVARDAGLGEIGRMGLLMTPKLGPRVRISVVTTDIPLATDNKSNDHTVTDFCVKCKKCAEICPSKAISFENIQEIDDVNRWKINSEACFTYWCTVGTDCARCVKVCPYSHPDNALHRLVRFGIRNSVLFRNLAVKMDDFLYGRKPVQTEVQDWMKIKELKNN